MSTGLQERVGLDGHPEPHGPRAVTAPRAGGVRLVVDAGAVTENTRRVAHHCRRRVLAVVKSDGYGHGAVTVARAALAGGAAGIGVASLEEAAVLRAAGVTAPLVCWSDPAPDAATAVELDCALAVAGAAALRRLVGAPAPVRVHLHVDTGLARDGAAPGSWPELAATAAGLAREGRVRVEGVMSQLGWTDAPGSPEVAAAVTAFHRAVATARAHGLAPTVLHLGGTPASLLEPRARLSRVRVGAALVGIAPEGVVGLAPTMSLSAPVVEVRDLAAGAAVGYGAEVVATATRVALVPLGYGDGLPRAASGARVAVRGELRPVLGMISMNALVVDLGPGSGADVGDRVVLIGDGARGEPTAADWARAAGTIPHEVLTAVGRCGQSRRMSA